MLQRGIAYRDRFLMLLMPRKISHASPLHGRRHKTQEATSIAIEAFVGRHC